MAFETNISTSGSAKDETTDNEIPSHRSQVMHDGGDDMEIDGVDLGDPINTDSDIDDIDYDLSENVAEDIIEYSRGEIIKNEEQSLLSLYGWLSGWLAKEDNYINFVTIGESAAGKTHKDKKMKQLLPHKDRYETTTSTGSGIVDDPEWDVSTVAIMSEWQKIGDDIREFMKSVAGDDGGFEKKRSLAGTEEAENTGPAGTNTIFKKAMPFSFTYAQFEMDHEMWTRLFKVYIDESKAVNEATVKLHAGYEDIELPDSLAGTYIYDTIEVQRALKKHIRNLPRDVHVYMPNWVFPVVSPILDMDRSEVKRVSAHLFNFIRVSCLTNYKNRSTTERVVDGESVKSFIVQPQDVANVIACRDTLVGTTHEIEPRKFKLIEAVEYKTRLGGDSICTIEDIQDYLMSDKSDMSRLKRSSLRDLLKELADNFIIKVHERYDGNSNGYEYNSLQQIGHPKLTGITDEEYPSDNPFLGIPDGVTNDQPLEHCIDPIRDQPISETVAQFRRDLSRDVLDQQDLSAGDVMGSDPYGESSDDASSNGSQNVYKKSQDTSQAGQSSLGDDTPEIEDPVTATVYDAVKETVRGETFDVETVGHEHIIGVCDPDESLSTIDANGTLADPDHTVWEQPNKPSGWVTSEADSNSELEKAYSELCDRGIVSYEQHRDDETIPDGELRVVTDEVDINV